MATSHINSTSDGLGRSFNDDDEFVRYIQTWLNEDWNVNYPTTSVIKPSTTPSNNANDSVGAVIVQQQQNKIIDDVLLMLDTSFHTIVETEYKTEALQLYQVLQRNVETTYRELNELDALTIDSTVSSASTSSSSDNAFPELLPPWNNI